ncbi:crossover junction endodeoxyribonuclease RuvC [Candidatus Parcubacteria bacterium]|nr:crossover junction endodeoxyribonuclease RuvC [Candidatus Parcubacteria bacterium]
MKVLAFDPGFERLGVAILEKKNGKEELLFSDCIRTSPKLSFPERLKELGKVAESLMQNWEPTAVALEQIFFEKNAKTAMQVAEVRGVLTYLAALHEIPVLQYAPAAVKVAITGYGKSDKAAVTMMVTRLVQVPAGKRLDDEMDAIAVGITCLASSAQFGKTPSIGTI